MKTRLKVLRAEHNLSQAELAEQVGVRRETISALEAGKYNPSLRLAWRIASVFEMPLEAVFDFSDES